MFDPAKDEVNVAKHGISLASAAAFDLSMAIVIADERRGYGERRYRAFGRVDGSPRCLAFTVRDGVTRVISYRRAHEKEMRRYGI